MLKKILLVLVASLVSSTVLANENKIDADVIRVSHLPSKHCSLVVVKKIYVKSKYNKVNNLFEVCYTADTALAKYLRVRDSITILLPDVDSLSSKGVVVDNLIINNVLSN